MSSASSVDQEVRSDGSPKPATGTENWQQHAKFRGRILYRDAVSSNMVSIIVEKPEGFDFKPGQGVSLSLDIDGKQDQKHPMAIVSLPHNPRLEFLIHNSSGESKLNVSLAEEVKIGTRVLFDDPTTMIEDEGPGVFVAGGAGLATFVSILRDRDRRGKLDGCRVFLVNDKSDEVYLQSELIRTLGHSITSTLTAEENRDFEQGPVDKKWLESRVESFDKPFYISGPSEMVKSVAAAVKQLGGKSQTVSWDGA